MMLRREVNEACNVAIHPDEMSSNASIAPGRSASAASLEQPSPLISDERHFHYVRRRLINAVALATSDIVALSLALLVAGGLRLLWLGDPLIPAQTALLLPVWICGSLLMHLLPSWGLGLVEELRRLTLLNLLAFAGLALMLFLSKQTETVSRLTLTATFAISLPLVPYMRLHVKRLLIRRKIWGLPTVVYGTGDAARRVVRLLRAEQSAGFAPICVLNDDTSRWGTRIENVPVLGGMNLTVRHAPAAILTMPDASRQRLVDLLEGPLASYRTVLLIPDLFEMPSLWVKPRDLHGVLGIEIPSNLTSPLARYTKRATDLFLVLLTALVWVPICAVIAGLIYLEDRQSPFFMQERIGQNGRPLKTWKFRTMHVDAERLLHRALVEDEKLRQEWEEHYKLRHDPRVTRIGRWLRRLSLDELPQLVNVLRGEMSLVGPRPLPSYHHDVLPTRMRDLRERVRPGLTGLWQTSGRSDTGTEGMKIWDAYYVRNWSLWLDMVVLFRTVRTVVKGTGAY